MSTTEVRHAILPTVRGRSGPYLCRHSARNGDRIPGEQHRPVGPGERINCPECRVVLNALRVRYPDFQYRDGRP